MSFQFISICNKHVQNIAYEAGLLNYTIFIAEFDDFLLKWELM